jgi:hypothetical protein
MDNRYCVRNGAARIACMLIAPVTSTESKYLALSLLILSALISTQATASPKYDREHNRVEMSTPLIDGDTGWMHIYSEEHIEIGAGGYNTEKEKGLVLCGKEPSLGFLFRDGRSNFELSPSVTDVKEFVPPHKSGYVHMYILKDDDALELMDILYIHESVSFGIVPNDLCPETENAISGKMLIKFDTRGLERVMKRIK